VTIKTEEREGCKGMEKKMGGWRIGEAGREE